MRKHPVYNVGQLEAMNVKDGEDCMQAARQEGSGATEDGAGLSITQDEVIQLAANAPRWWQTLRFERCTCRTSVPGAPTAECAQAGSSAGAAPTDSSAQSAR